MKVIEKIEEYSVENSTRYIFSLHDGSIVEMAVFIHKEQLHFCVSSQVGCPVGCLHCATTYAPIQYRRNLNTIELCSMIEYVLGKEDFYKDRVLSFSGHGEPTLNWDTVVKVKLYFHKTFNKFYVTTIGNRDIFKKLIEKKETDSVFYLSLHGSTDEERAWLMPNAKTFCSLDELVSFVHMYSEQGGKVVINYMLHKYNSDKACLDRVIQLMRGNNHNVSLRFTEFNQIGGNTNIVGLSDVEIESVLSYFEARMNQSMKWSYRYSRLEGKDIGIACGQLRADIVKGKDK